MPFNFTFSFAVAGVANPFSATSDARRAQDVAPPAGDKTPAPAVAPAQRRPHPATLPPALPLSRKRGWVPPDAEPSQAATNRMSPSGYLDTPAKYRDFTVTPHAREENEDAVEEMVAELPPAKRRRGLAGSIVSTAVSAALIGTAVGLTVYRLWRDRGKEPEHPPPPYEQGDWIHQQNSSSEPQAGAPPVNVIPPTPRHKKPRQVPIAARRSPARPRRARAHVHSTASATRSVSPVQTSVQSEFNFAPAPAPPPEPEDEDMEDTMDWMGGRLAQLIEEGKRALGKEVVVMSEAQEDEVDDGSGAWEEEEDPMSSLGTTSRRGSIRGKRRPQHLGLPGSYISSNMPVSASTSTSFLSPSTNASPRRSGFESLSSPVYGSIQIPGRGGSEDRGLSGSFRENSTQWQSPELRETMEKARARYLQARS